MIIIIIIIYWIHWNLRRFRYCPNVKLYRSRQGSKCKRNVWYGLCITISTFKIAISEWHRRIIWIGNWIRCGSRNFVYLHLSNVIRHQIVFGFSYVWYSTWRTRRPIMSIQTTIKTNNNSQVTIHIINGRCNRVVATKKKMAISIHVLPFERNAHTTLNSSMHNIVVIVVVSINFFFFFYGSDSGSGTYHLIGRHYIWLLGSKERETKISLTETVHWTTKRNFEYARYDSGTTYHTQMVCCRPIGI